mgnify:CR=1 FL=1
MDIVAEAVVDEGQAEPSSNPTNPILNPRPEPIGTKPIASDDDVAAEVKKEFSDEEAEAYSKKVQSRINKEIARRKSAEENLRRIEDRILTMEARQSAPQQQSRVAEGEPTIDKFDNFDEYVAAKAEYIARKQIESTLTEREQRQQVEREAAERRKTADSWNKRIAAATAEMPDFEEVLASSDVPMTPPMQRAIMESDIGPKLAYYLANNPDEAEQIAGMSPIGAIRTLGRIEERLANAKPEVKTTNAPPPIKPVGAKAVVTKDPGKMSDAEYEKWRKSGRAA